MSHYEERLEQDLNRILTTVRDLGERVESAVELAVRAVLVSDDDLASQVILGDQPINRDIRSLDWLCHVFVARHLPSAGHLRLVSSVLRLNIAIERSGDYAASIAREAVQLADRPSELVTRDIQLMSEQSRHMFRQAVNAFCGGNAELARGIAGMRDQVEASFQKVFADLISEGESGRHSVKDVLAQLVVLNRLSRVASQAKNICEETIFRVTGETKAPKTYRILFIDERNDCVSQLAEAYGRKAFPNSGEFTSAGWRPAEALDQQFEAFADDQGLDRRNARPKPLSTQAEELARQHIIVSLDPDGRSHLRELPFQTTFLQWRLPGVHLEERYRELGLRIRELMETLRGEQAD